MSNTHQPHQPHQPHLLRCVSAAFLLSGILLISTSSARLVSAALTTGQGSSVMRVAEIGEPMLQAAERVSIVPLPNAGRADAELRLVVGMLLVLAGFGFHGLCVTRAMRIAPTPVRRRKGMRRTGTGMAAALHRAFHASLV